MTRQTFIADRFITADPALAEADWIVVSGGRIIQVGQGEPAAGDVRPIRLPGTVLPGLIDSHVHLTTTGLYSLGLDFRGCRSVVELLDEVRRYLATNTDEWVIGGNFDPGRNTDARMPTSDELNTVSGDRKLVVSRADGHSCALNAKGLAAIGLPPRLTGIEVDHSGQASGVLADEANYEARRRFFSQLPEEQILRAQHEAARIALSRGVTTVHEMSGGSFMGDKDFEVLTERFIAEAPIHVRPYLATTDVGRVVAKGLDCIGGDLFLDGSIGSRTAAMTVPYENELGKGHLYHDDDEIVEFFANASRAGLQAGVHAIGDAAIEQALNCLEEAFVTLGPEGAMGARRLRHRIEHFECVSEVQIQRACRLGVLASVQPMFDRYWGGVGGMYESRLGNRSKTMNPFSLMVESGMVLAGGSDSTVTPLDPFMGIAAAMNHHEDRFRVTFPDALAMFCVSGALSAHEEAERGSISVGKVADLCVIERDPTGLSPDEVAGSVVLQTWVSGRLAWDAVA
ncbi:MAG: amidohydrolase [Actinomycetota bacterium]